MIWRKDWINKKRYLFLVTIADEIEKKKNVAIKKENYIVENQ